jgi:hypothetical protein
MVPICVTLADRNQPINDGGGGKCRRYHEHAIE